MARKSPWMDDRAELLIHLLEDRHGLPVDLDIAREDVSNQVDRIAERLRIGRQSAKRYVTDEFISGLADHIAQEFHRKANPDGGAPNLRIVE